MQNIDAEHIRYVDGNVYLRFLAFDWIAYLYCVRIVAQVFLVANENDRDIRAEVFDL